MIWATQASAASWLTRSGLALDDRGFIKVNSALQSISHENVFAAGDIASGRIFSPKSGVFAVRQGLPLAKNLLRSARGLKPKTFHPQKHFLSSYQPVTNQRSPVVVGLPCRENGAGPGRTD